MENFRNEAPISLTAASGFVMIRKTFKASPERLVRRDEEKMIRTAFRANSCKESFFLRKNPAFEPLNPRFLESLISRFLQDNWIKWARSRRRAQLIFVG